MRTKQILLLVLLTLSSHVTSASVDEEWIFALTKRDMAAIDRLIKRGADVNLAAENGRTALMLAAKEGQVQLVRDLLSAGADVNLANHRGGTALMFAVLAGDPTTVKVLLSHRAAVNAKGAFEWTAIMIASVKGYDEIVKLLLNHGAEVNVPDVYRWTPLMRAVYENRLSVVRLLLESGAVDLNARNDHGATALHYAAAMGYLEMARLLIAYGADLESTDVNGRTPLTVAMEEGRRKLVDLINRSLDRP